MESINMEEYGVIILGTMALLLLILLVWTVLLQWQLGKVKKKYRRIVGNSSIPDVDGLLMQLQASIQHAGAAEKQNAEAIKDLRHYLSHMKGHTAVSRYNAFHQNGSDLSFSVAFLDEERNGVVLTGIHSRDESYMYAKPVEKGESKYTLSPEEKQVIGQVFAKRDR